MNNYPLPHAMSRFAAVTERLIEKCQQDYFTGRNLAHSAPSLSLADTTILVTESLEADGLIAQPHDTLAEHARRGDLSDWSMVVLAEMFFTWAADIREKSGDDIFTQSRMDEYTALAWTALHHAATSPTLSPMVWYEEIYFEVGQQFRRERDSQALDYMQRGLRHDLHYYEGKNLANFVRDLAETHLNLGQFNQALQLLTGLLQNDPADVWTYNMMAFALKKFGLITPGRRAAERALELIKFLDEDVALEKQLTNALHDINNYSGPNRETEADPHLLAELRQALALDFETGKRLAPAELAPQLIPDFEAIPLKIHQPTPILPPPPARIARPNRNDPCWCGSGKKYKHCHMAQDNTSR